MAYAVALTETAAKMLKAIPDRRIQGQLIARIERLSEEPEKQGSALRGPLVGYRSCRAVGQRYRIIYKVQVEELTVLVVAAGIRKKGDNRDIYALAQRLVRLGLLPGP